MTVKALKKQLMAAIAMVVVSAIALSSSTYAWFAANTKVQATGMQARATTSSSLVISNLSNVGTETVHNFTSSATVLTPASHLDTNNQPASGTNVNNLVTITNANAVNAQTGYASTGNNLEYKYVDNSSNNYYYDYVCYIASAGAAMENKSLKVKISDSAATELKTYNALSIDFYAELLADPSDALNIDSYKGTLNKAQLNSLTNDGSTTLNTVTLLSNITIPVNGQTGTTTEGAYLRVTMRVYIDGDLKQSTDANDNAGQAYVFSNKVDVDSATINVEFEAE